MRYAPSYPSNTTIGKSLYLVGFCLSVYSWWVGYHHVIILVVSGAMLLFIWAMSFKERADRGEVSFFKTAETTCLHCKRKFKYRVPACKEKQFLLFIRACPWCGECRRLSLK